MFLKSVTLKGFKSFADATTLEFEPGITVVVGPNGSGKSNVVDAVAWVLGAQGPRTVRSSKMDDVIFAGTAKRPALGRAEVSLTIDNSSGQLPIDFSEVTITRTLYRSGDSEYSINKVPCRLLDVQDLLSDTGVGRQQHVIISQGNLDSILSSRAEERRQVIEEAAGILKFRRRKERAGRRLDSTESSMVRLQDLLREVRRQLRPLERQADAARRHGDLLGELTAIRRHLAGRELMAIEARLAASRGTHAELGRTEDEVVRLLARLDAEVITSEAELAEARERSDAADLGEALSHAEGLRARAQGLTALISERRRSVDRELAVSVDADVVASLEAEATDLRRRLQVAESESGELLPQEREVSQAEASLAVEAADVESGEVGFDKVAPGDVGTGEGGFGRRESGELGGAAESEGGAGAPTAVAGFGRDPAAEVRAELSATRSTLERARAEMRRLEGRAGSVQLRVTRLAEEMARLTAVGVETQRAAGQLVAEAAAAEVREAAAAEEMAAAEDLRRLCDAEHDRWASRRETLAEALAEGRARAGAERLAEVAGVVGTLLELVDVDPGWETAFEAAAGEVVAAVVVDGVGAARRSLEQLSKLRVSGAVVALRESPVAASPGAASPGAASPVAASPVAASPVAASPGAASPVAASPVAASPAAASLLATSLVAAAEPQFFGSLPGNAEPLRSHVRTWLPGVEHLVDELLAGTVAVDGHWSEAVDLARERPDLVIVTLTGDRLAQGVWRVGAGGAGATGAALEEARVAAMSCSEAVERAVEAVGTARLSLDVARMTRAEAQAMVELNLARGTAARDALRRTEADCADARIEAEAGVGQRAETASLVEREQTRITELETLLPGLLEANAIQAERALAQRVARSRLAERRGAVEALRRDLEVRAAALEERRALITRRLSEVESRLERNVVERGAAADRRRALVGMAEVVTRLADQVSARQDQLDRLVGYLREERRRELEVNRVVTDRLEQLRRQRAAGERQLSELREQAKRSELDSAEARIRLENLTEIVRRELDCEPETTRNAPCPALPPGTSATSRRSELERELRLMGPINPLALDEHAALSERHRFLEDQLEDIRAARRELAKVVRAIDAEIVEVFRAAYADVAENFTTLFCTLFPGGHGQLRLTDPDQLLDSGIEMEARPSGKNVRRLSLLSGGERSLTAMAFLFAVFRSRPSPFYLMDEVEAALDDVNLHRFLDLVHEFGSDAQLVIVSHQKRTMEAADCLYGVTMSPGGSSVVVSEKLSTAAV